MQREGKIGPRDENGALRPFAEFPKTIHLADGTSKIVHSQRDELACAGMIAGEPVLDDPVVEERNRLAATNALMQKELEEARAELRRLAGASHG
jgi:hypothetical protein